MLVVCVHYIPAGETDCSLQLSGPCWISQYRTPFHTFITHASPPPLRQSNWVATDQIKYSSRRQKFRGIDSERTSVGNNQLFGLFRLPRNNFLAEISNPVGALYLARYWLLASWDAQTVMTAIFYWSILENVCTCSFDSRLYFFTN